MSDKPTVVISGVSSGIGWGTAKVLLGAGFEVFGSVRKQADAERLQQEFGEGFTPLIFDVLDEDAVAQGAALVREKLAGRTLHGLINNAGVSGGGPAIEQPMSEIRHIIEVNVFGLMHTTRAFTPLLGADRSLKGKPGRIVQISSVAGRLSAPFMSAYSASKFAVEGYSHSLRRELLIYDIDVILIGPGPIKTKIWDKAEEIDTAQYENSEYLPALKALLDYMLTIGRNGFPPERVGELVLHVLTASRPKHRYPILPGKFINWTLPTKLPARTLDKILAKRLGIAALRDKLLLSK